MVVLVVIIVALTLIVLVTVRWHEKSTNAICKSKKSLKGKIAIVTGGTTGIGLEIAKEFARRQAKVIIACPFENEGDDAKKNIIEATGNDQIIFKLLDLKSLKSVRDFAAEVLKEENRLDILVNNAGIGAHKDLKSYNGANVTMQVNYFGHFLLTILLMPLLKKTGTSDEPSRIVYTGSILHLIGRLDYNVSKSVMFLVLLLHYCNSKYCCMVIAHELSKRLKGSNVTVNAVNPGAVGTGIYDEIWFGSVAKFISKYCFKTPWEGAQTTLHVALDEEGGEVTGQYFQNCKLHRAKNYVYDDKTGRTLWEDSVKIVELDDKELKRCLYD